MQIYRWDTHFFKASMIITAINPDIVNNYMIKIYENKRINGCKGIEMRFIYKNGIMTYWLADKNAATFDDFINCLSLYLKYLPYVK